MSADQKADQYFMSLKSMYHEGIISESDYLRIQRSVLIWADKIPSEAEAFGSDCRGGNCEV